MNISLKQLHVFSAVAQYRTLTEASEKLFLSKAAVSLSLSELEKHIGHTLFDRVNNRLRLNHQGKELLPLADELLERATQIDGIFNNEKSLIGTLRIGASDTLGNQVVPKLLSLFRTKHDHNSQSLFISNSMLICQKLVDFDLDIALIEGKAQHPQLLSYEFSGDSMCFVCSANSPLAHSPNLQFVDIEQQQWILREAGSGTREFFIQNVASQLQHWQQVFELNSTEAIINSVTAGLGIACLSELAAQAALADGRVVKVNIESEITMERKFWLLIHKDKYQSPLIKTFIDFCNNWQTH